MKLADPPSAVTCRLDGLYTSPETKLCVFLPRLNSTQQRNLTLEKELASTPIPQNWQQICELQETQRVLGCLKGNIGSQRVKYRDFFFEASGFAKKQSTSRSAQ